MNNTANSSHAHQAFSFIGLPLEPDDQFDAEQLGQPLSGLPLSQSGAIPPRLATPTENYAIYQMRPQLTMCTNSTASTSSSDSSSLSQARVSFKRNRSKHARRSNPTSSDMAIPPLPNAKSRQGSTLINPARRCTTCDTTETPQWRSGPHGPCTLCNVCGLLFAKKETKTRSYLLRREFGPGPPCKAASMP
ncbi:hypothetical protein F66182_3523 [Fusarium sp. NRRL 66182]|nr:hypothetical protein F66182_3523 [Fusarium sp. NRRL 66182]